MEITITNNLDQVLDIYDTFGQSLDNYQNYYLTMTRLAQANAKTDTKVQGQHALNPLSLFDQDQKPVARFVARRGADHFTVTQDNLLAMQQAMNLVDYIANNPNSDIAIQVKKLKSAKDLDSFLKQQPDYSQVNTAIYMMALTYKATQPVALKNPPTERTYSLSQLISYLSNTPYPSGELPDITVSHFFYRDDNDIIECGGKVKIVDIPFFNNEEVKNAIHQMFPGGDELNVKFAFDEQVGLNFAGTKLEFYYNEVDIPLGDSKALKILKPTISLTITPLFQFFVFEMKGTIPFSIFNSPVIDADIALTIDNIEAEIGFLLRGDKTSLLTPPLIKGLHLDEFGVGMGLIFELPGFAIGLQGKFHIGNPGQVRLNDDNFAIICGVFEGEPVPLYLAFYVPQLNLQEVISLFTDTNLQVDLPISFSDLSFRYNANPLMPYVLPDGSLAPGGYGFSSVVDLFGFQFYGYLQIELTGIQGTITSSPIHMGNILSVTGKGGGEKIKVDSSGKPLPIHTIPKTKKDRDVVENAPLKQVVQPGGPVVKVNIPGSSPYFKASVQVDFLDASETLDTEINRDGLVFSLDFSALGVQDSMQCLLGWKGGNLHFTGRFSFSINQSIPFVNKILGSIALNTSISTSIDIENQNENISFTLGFEFQFSGSTISKDKIECSLDIHSLKDVIAQISNHISQYAGDLFSEFERDANKWLGAAKEGGIVVSDVASALSKVFNQDAEGAARLMKDTGYAIGDIVNGLIKSYQEPPGSEHYYHTILENVGYKEEDIQTALKIAQEAIDNDDLDI